MLAKLTNRLDKQDEVLADVEYAINNTINRLMGESSAKLLFGVNQCGKVQDSLKEFVEVEEDSERYLPGLRQHAAKAIENPQTYNKSYYDAKRKDTKI